MRHGPIVQKCQNIFRKSLFVAIRLVFSGSVSRDHEELDMTFLLRIYNAICDSLEVVVSGTFCCARAGRPSSLMRLLIGSIGPRRRQEILIARKG